MEVKLSFLNFEDIKASNPIETVAERLGLNMTKSGASLRGKCPVCESSGDRNLAITPAKELFYCFSDGKGGDVISLVAHVKGIGVKEAAQWLSGTPQTAKEKKGQPTSEDGFKALDYLQHDHESVIALGFEPDDAERLGIGYAPRGIFRGKVAVPVRLANGRLAGYLAVTDVTLPPKWSF